MQSTESIQLCSAGKLHRTYVGEMEIVPQAMKWILSLMENEERRKQYKKPTKKTNI